MILIIDNYDSFTHNLYQMVGAINPDIQVVRNDALTVSQVAEMAPSHVILSPGPGYPRDAGICIDVVKELAGRFPILGVCLGHQGICEAYGATITHAQSLMHGKSSLISILGDSPLFAGLDSEVQVGRYHSLAADPSTIPDVLQVTAISDDGEIQAVEHHHLPVFGVQFHPESVLTPQGSIMLTNFVERTSS
ncbi:MAG: aminodeoxychorismate/anthranilate synthase component II [Propionibacteriaceae bacterium]|jgi:anthranilate synthase component 2|nr:aminodeoxychorismate/anthranilate synthase component II [Propionibacteriaceae bacterium]